jgi:hypothetical protein
LPDVVDELPGANSQTWCPVLANAWVIFITWKVFAWREGIAVGAMTAIFKVNQAPYS